MTPERREKITNVLNSRQPDLVVVMENVHDPHNVSAVMRSCDAVGIQNIYVLNTRIAQPEKFGHKSSGSAANWLTVHYFDNVKECFETLKQRYRVYATHLGKDAVSLYDIDLTEPVALVFGNEHLGVSEESLQYCDGNFIIPQMGMVKSLNISVACAVSVYEAMRQRQQAGFYNGVSRLSVAEQNALADKWSLINKKKQP